MVTHDGRELGRPTVTVAPRGSAIASLAIPLPRAGVLRVAIDDNGGLPDDDARVRPRITLPLTLAPAPAPQPSR